MDYESLEKRVEKLEEKQESYNNDISQVLQKIAKIESILEGKDQITTLQSEVENQRILAMEDRIRKLEESQTWLRRSVIGEIIAIIFTLVTAHM